MATHAVLTYSYRNINGNNDVKSNNFGGQAHFDGAPRKASAVVIALKPPLLLMTNPRARNKGK